ncbi:MAG TPA: hypothetical protein VHS57_05420, partial [Acidimicrobiales bacterium]|nr:hypothetical protein [Acidimicrobiales bacterium]
MRPEVEPELPTPTERPPMVIVGVLTGTGTGSGTLTVVEPPPDEPLLGVLAVGAPPEEGVTPGTVTPVVV